MVRKLGKTYLLEGHSPQTMKNWNSRKSDHLVYSILRGSTAEEFLVRKEVGPKTELIAY
jgi:hypothetical protein